MKRYLARSDIDSGTIGSQDSPDCTLEQSQPVATHELADIVVGVSASDKRARCVPVLRVILESLMAVADGPDFQRRRDLLIDLMASVDDMPEVVMKESLSWQWSPSVISWIPSLRADTTWISAHSSQMHRCASTSWASAGSTANPQPPRTSPKCGRSLYRRCDRARSAFPLRAGCTTSRLRAHRRRRWTPKSKRWSALHWG